MAKRTGQAQAGKKKRAALRQQDCPVESVM